ncbi:putative photosynthetic complex assembly protein 2 [Cognatiyoonia koreensis]|uniref:Putative photosynthetic complex assembly protein 2 n=1 Tax=Cognatiyoonia koreensis TaxID=364200 RepID=A0A1I0RR28_9RHOB|nr:putative photosynthetic complex assembly protein 2 [Cognatiyoonia koreensis]
MIFASVIAAVFVWWLSTGTLLLVVRRADRKGGDAHAMAVLIGLPFLALGIAAVVLSLQQQDLMSVYLGFLGALAVWGWAELAFLTGIIAGPVRQDCPDDLDPQTRFGRAFGTVVYHEMLLLVGLLGLVVVSSGAANRMALATYMILFLARISAKLNLFFGVPRINTEFVPDQLHHLKTYFRKGPVTIAFPIAITVLTALLAVCVERLVAAETVVTQTGFALLTALSALALLEHWLMVVPLPDAKLWRWMLPAPKPITTKDENHGF